MNSEEKGLIDFHTHSLREGITSVYQLDINGLAIETDYYSFGIHPELVHLLTDEQILHYLQKIEKSACIAIGECGLDNRYSDLTRQEIVYKEQLKLAEKSNKPIVLHCVGEIDRCLNIYKKSSNSKPLLFHGFSKASAFERISTFDCVHFGIGARLLTDNNLRLLVREKLELERLIIETDDKEVDIRVLYQLISELKGLNLSEVIASQVNNFKRIFNVELA